MDEKLPGTKSIAQRAVNAENNFDETLMEIAGISKGEAEKVRAYYIKNKIAKTDFVVGRISVKHGAFMDKETILRALDIQNGKAKVV